MYIEVMSRKCQVELKPAKVVVQRNLAFHYPILKCNITKKLNIIEILQVPERCLLLQWNLPL